jgi:hypothetical protein
MEWVILMNRPGAEKKGVQDIGFANPVKKEICL